MVMIIEICTFLPSFYVLVCLLIKSITRSIHVFCNVYLFFFFFVVGGKVLKCKLVNECTLQSFFLSFFLYFFLSLYRLCFF